MILATLVLFPLAGPAGLHEAGNLTVSFGGSVSHTQTRDRKAQYSTQFVDDELLFTDIDLEEEPESYSDLDLTLFLSVGYFVIDRVEVGVSGSALTTWYYETDQSDFGVYDARAHVRYFFDNPSVLTPYVKLQGGTTWIDSGSYEEVHDSGAVVLGLEVFGMGSMTWFVELSSEYTELGGDLSGSEWRNQLYIGVTWYLNLNRKREKTAAGQ